MVAGAGLSPFEQATTPVVGKRWLMPPILFWVVCFLSAALLVAGGFVLGRALATRGAAQGAADLARLRGACSKLMEERRARQARERELVGELEAARAALAAQASVPGEASGFEGPTRLPDPRSFFERDSVPHLERVSEDEFEIQGAARRSAKEAVERAEPDEGLGGHDETRQFNLHSPENVVQFMQRIDELAEENGELKAVVAELEASLKERQAEGNEQIHRFAALDAITEKLRAELKRRNERIRVLEDQLGERLAKDDGPLEGPQGAAGGEISSATAPPPPPAGAGRGPPPVPRASFSVSRDEIELSRLEVAGPNDGPTLPVGRFSPEELEEGGK